MQNDPRAILAQEKMGWTQIIGVAVCFLLNALDGFDILSISFASPGIAAEWGIDRAALGVVLSMELIGMAIGSFTLGSLADRIGRRPTTLGSLVVMATGMFLASTAKDVTSLSIFRLITGFGIGGMLACTAAMTAELANDRSRYLAVTIMAAGYPVGAAGGGTIASMLLAGGDWRSVFLFGATATALMIPVVIFLLPESVSFLSRRGTPDARERANRVLARMGHRRADSLPPPAPPRVPLVALFAPSLIAATLLMTITYSMHIMTFYYIIKWVPKIVVDMGFPASSVGGVLVWANVGGAAGALALSLLTQRFDVRRLLLIVLVISFVMVSLFGLVKPDLAQLSMVSGGAGFFTNGAVVAIYALIAKYFPSDVRAGGTGFVIGVGRGGAAASPIVAGLLFTAGLGLPAVSILMASGSLIALAALLVLGNRPSAGL
jgi:benzoate transport